MLPSTNMNTAHDIGQPINPAQKVFGTFCTCQLYSHTRVRNSFTTRLQSFSQRLASYSQYFHFVNDTISKVIIRTDVSLI